MGTSSWGKAGIKLHVSYTNTTGMPLKVVETTGLKHDGPIGIQLEDPRFILVGDRAYFSIEKIDRYLNEKQDFVFRLKENITLYRKKIWQEHVQKGLMSWQISLVSLVFHRMKLKKDIGSWNF